MSIWDIWYGDINGMLNIIQATWRTIFLPTLNLTPLSILCATFHFLPPFINFMSLWHNRKNVLPCKWSRFLNASRNRRNCLNVIFITNIFGWWFSEEYLWLSYEGKNFGVHFFSHSFHLVSLKALHKFQAFITLNEWTKNAAKIIVIRIKFIKSFFIMKNRRTAMFSSNFSFSSRWAAKKWQMVRNNKRLEGGWKQFPFPALHNVHRKVSWKEKLN